MSQKQLRYMTIIELSTRIRARELSPVEATRAMLDRIGELDGHLKSYATVMTERALAAAERAEREIVSGGWRGPLHGVPVAVKDLCYTAGVRTMGGSKVYADHTPTFDATVVSRLASAGAVLLGKLNLTEGAMGGYNPEFDIPLNPWDNDRWAGSSSSGSGAATAAGLCYGSLGSDTGGSIRFPAAACGITGLKPTWGRVSRYGVLALAESLDHVGPMTRTVADAAAMLDAISGYDPNDPTSLSDGPTACMSTIDRGVRGVRIGIDPHHISDGVDPELSSAVLDGVEELEGLGAEIVEIEMPDIDRYLPAWPVLCSAEAVAAHRENYPDRRDDYGPWFRGWLDMGAAKSGADYAEANNMRAECNGLVREAFLEIDLMACPSTIGPAYPVTPEMLYGEMDGRRGTSFQRYTVPYNFNGAPTLSVPCGFDGDGLPLSLQLVGKPLSEALLCRAGHAYQQTTTWHMQTPPGY